MFQLCTFFFPFKSNFSSLCRSIRPHLGKKLTQMISGRVVHQLLNKRFHTHSYVRPSMTLCMCCYSHYFLCWELGLYVAMLYNCCGFNDQVLKGYETEYFGVFQLNFVMTQNWKKLKGRDKEPKHLSIVQLICFNG